MNICIVIPSFYPATIFGGTIYSSLYTAQELGKLGYEIRVSTTNTNRDAHLNVPLNSFQDISPNVSVKYYHDTILNRFSFPLFRSIAKDIKQCDVVYINAVFNSPIPIALFHAYRLKKPVLLSPHGVLGSWIMNQGIPFKKFWLNLFIKPYIKSIHWHATSEQEKDEILSHFPTAKVHIIPLGIHVKDFVPTQTLSPSEFCRKFVQKDIDAEQIIVSMGRMHAKKGFNILIRSFAKLLHEYPKAVLCIAGDDEGEKDNLQGLIESLELQNSIFLLKPLYNEDKTLFLSQADVFALPSHNENFGIVYLEALASGTPIVASIHTPWKNIEEFNCGKWVNNTSEDFYAAIKNLLQQDKVQYSLNATSLAFKLDWSNIALMYREVFLKLLNRD